MTVAFYILRQYDPAAGNRTTSGNDDFSMTCLQKIITRMNGQITDGTTSFLSHGPAPNFCRRAASLPDRADGLDISGK